MRNWTSIEITLLKNTYGRLSASEIGHLIDRSKRAVCRKAKKLEICRIVERHGMTGTRLYRVWSGMKKRCTNPRHKFFHRYGGREVKVCDEWSRSFVAFRDFALANGYREGLTIDRINNDGNYCPENCRFVTQGENNRNGSRAKLRYDQVLTIHWLRDMFGQSYKELGKLFSVSHSTIGDILRGDKWKDAFLEYKK